ncbi:hypothetical protein [Streptomyces sp. DH10]|uniref:hypothetical protein n=1 Tax=Streptomyces sp. DH10 TaxID=3040121 RepID=UPI0024422388|nr:hypothetical protein [Streptomyces sp. DH10]MDG9712633.1 hypothetical protein [Streptomyces sp. DH10]
MLLNKLHALTVRAWAKLRGEPVTIRRLRVLEPGEYGHPVRDNSGPARPPSSDGAEAATHDGAQPGEADTVASSVDELRHLSILSRSPAAWRYDFYRRVLAEHASILSNMGYYTSEAHSASALVDLLTAAAREATGRPAERDSDGDQFNDAEAYYADLPPEQRRHLAAETAETINNTLARLFVRLGPPPEGLEHDSSPATSGDGGANR